MTTAPLLFKDLASKTYTPTLDGFDESWRPLLSILLGLGRAAGADFVEVFLEKRNHLQCMVESGKVTSVSPTLAGGGGVRVFKGREDSYVSTNDLSYAGLRWALETSLAALDLSIPAGHFFIPEINLEPLRDYGSLRGKNAWIRECPTTRETNDTLLRGNAALKQKVAHAQSLISQAFRDHQEVLVAASDGIFARDIRLAQRLSEIVVCVDGAHRSSVNENAGDQGNPQFLRNANLDQMAQALAESSGQMLHADFVQAGRYPIVMANEFGGVIFHEACGHLLETTQIERKTTPFAEMRGKQVAHSNLTAWDEGLTANAFGSIDMDDEGMPAQRTLLIENGTLKNFLADRGGSLRTGHPRTGSGRRQNYTYAAASRMRNTYIAPGPHTKEQLLSSLDKGLYCKKLGGGSVGATGEFNFAVSEAYLVENGKITRPVKGATLIGEAKEVMQQISLCANDIGLASGFCGSVSGSIYVTVGQPHIRVDAITVGGR